MLYHIGKFSVKLSNVQQQYELESILDMGAK